MPPPPLPGSCISGDRGSQVLESSARVDSPPVKNPGDKGKMCPLGSLFSAPSFHGALDPL